MFPVRYVFGLFSFKNENKIFENQRPDKVFQSQALREMSHYISMAGFLGRSVGWGSSGLLSMLSHDSCNSSPLSTHHSCHGEDIYAQSSGLFRVSWFLSGRSKVILVYNIIFSSISQYIGIVYW